MPLEVIFMNNLEIIWQENEQLLEEKTGCSIRQLRSNNEIIENGLKDKFSTEKLLGKSCFDEILTKIKKEIPANWSVAEICLRRHEKIIDLKSKIKQEKQTYMDACKAERLWNMIQECVLPMEVFWSMEYAESNDYELSDKERNILEYMREIGQHYLDETHDLSVYASSIDLNQII